MVYSLSTALGEKSTCLEKKKQGVDMEGNGKTLNGKNSKKEKKIRIPKWALTDNSGNYRVTPEST